MPKIIKIKKFNLRGVEYKCIPDDNFWDCRMREGEIKGSHLFYQSQFWRIIA